ncbi:MAG: mechanosensitive ion channel family protein [Acidobacteria bacterium]|nr:mechanosensitive ion channel family protein [Acidobacteriota bacterium]
MEWVQELLVRGAVWLPTAVAVIVTAVVLAGARRILIVNQQPQGLGARAIVRQLGMLLLTVICVVAVILTLPVGDTARGQLLSLLGLVTTAAIALSSTTFIGNAMAGLMLQAVRHIRPGDFIRVGDHFGRVSEQGILHTEIQTEDRDLTTLPNLYLVSNPVTVVRSSGTIISASVSLGYEVPRMKVETLLRQAAERAELGEPFVQILELGDFSVHYRIAGFLPDAKHLITARSRLRMMMLDSLHEGGIEIVSPTYMNQRQMREGQASVPPLESEAPPVSTLPEDQGEIPESLMFDKAEKAQSIDQAREQMKLVIDRIAETSKARDGSTDEGRRARLDAQLEILEQQRARFEEQLERMIAAQQPKAAD